MVLSGAGNLSVSNVCADRAFVGDRQYSVAASCWKYMVYYCSERNRQSAGRLPKIKYKPGRRARCHDRHPIVGLENRRISSDRWQVGAFGGTADKSSTAAPQRVSADRRLEDQLPGSMAHEVTTWNVRRLPRTAHHVRPGIRDETDRNRKPHRTDLRQNCQSGVSRDRYAAPIGGRHVFAFGANHQDVESQRKRLVSDETKAKSERRNSGGNTQL